jgi:hypothetical protein
LKTNRPLRSESRRSGRGGRQGRAPWVGMIISCWGSRECERGFGADPPLHSAPWRRWPASLRDRAMSFDRGAFLGSPRIQRFKSTALETKAESAALNVFLCPFRSFLGFCGRLS